MTSAKKCQKFDPPTPPSASIQKSLTHPPPVWMLDVRFSVFHPPPPPQKKQKKKKQERRKKRVILFETERQGQLIAILKS